MSRRLDARRRSTFELRFVKTSLALGFVIGVMMPTVANARGPLQVGEVVSLAQVPSQPGGSQGLILVRTPLAGQDSETITVEPRTHAGNLAILDRNTVFYSTAEALPPYPGATSYSWDRVVSRIWKVDVRSGEKWLAAEFQNVNAQHSYLMALGPNGNPHVLVSDGGERRIVRINKDNFDQTVLGASSSPLVQDTGFLGGLVVTHDGDIYVHGCQGRTLRFGTGPAAQIDLVYDNAYACSDIKLHPTTGELLLVGPTSLPIEAFYTAYQPWGVEPFPGGTWTDIDGTVYTWEEFLALAASTFGDPVETPALVALDSSDFSARPLAYGSTPELGLFSILFWLAESSSSSLSFGVEQNGEILVADPDYSGADFLLYRFDPETQARLAVHDLGKLRAREVAVVLPECSNGLDDDHDGLADADDPQCDHPLRDREVSGCSDGLDNDADGLVDLEDYVDCPDASGDGEIPDCADGLDNDGDGLVDRFDPMCLDAFDASEFPECSDGIDNDGNGVADDYDATCFYAEQECEGPVCRDPMPACSDGYDNDGDGFFDFPDDPHCINAFNESELPACSDGIDNDADGFTDLFDDDCDELTGTGELPDCNDGEDNDQDGLIDFPEDTGCSGQFDASEREVCSDAIDNDEDGLIDLNDPDCRDGTDPTEESRACSDGIDNDGDGFTDYPDDPECLLGPEQPFEACQMSVAGSVQARPFLVLVCGLLWLAIFRRRVLR